MRTTALPPIVGMFPYFKISRFYSQGSASTTLQESDGFFLSFRASDEFLQSDSLSDLLERMVYFARSTACLKVIIYPVLRGSLVCPFEVVSVHQCECCLWSRICIFSIRIFEMKDTHLLRCGFSKYRLSGTTSLFFKSLVYINVDTFFQSSSYFQKKSHIHFGCTAVLCFEELNYLGKLSNTNGRTT